MPITNPACLLGMSYRPRSNRPHWLDHHQVMNTEHVRKWLYNPPGMFPRDASRMRRYRIIPDLDTVPMLCEWSTQDRRQWIKMTGTVWDSLQENCFPYRSASWQVNKQYAMMAWIRNNIMGIGQAVLLRSMYSESLDIRFHREEDHVLWRMVWE